MDARDITVKTLAAFEVAGDGRDIGMSFTCANGATGLLRIPAECLKQLIMTLPRMMQQALRARYRDDSLRLVFPVGATRIEQSSDPRVVIVTLATTDGFEASFGFRQDQLEAFGEALRQARAASSPSRSDKIN